VENRWGFRAPIAEFDGRCLRVVTLYIDLTERPSAESREISTGVVLDCDEDGNLVGIDIDNASTKVQLSELVVRGLGSGLSRPAG